MSEAGPTVSHGGIHLEHLFQISRTSTRTHPVLHTKIKRYHHCGYQPLQSSKHTHFISEPWCNKDTKQTTTPLKQDPPRDLDTLECLNTSHGLQTLVVKHLVCIFSSHVRLLSNNRNPNNRIVIQHEIPERWGVGGEERERERGKVSRGRASRAIAA